MGLINREAVEAQPPEQPLEQPEPGKPTAQPDSGSSDVVARVAAAGARLLYKPETTKAVLQMMEKAPAPEVGLAQATVLIMGELVKMSNNTVPQEARVPAGKEIMQRIAELGQAAGLIENPKQTIDQASALIVRELLKAMKGGQPQQPQPPEAPPPEQLPVEEELPV